MHAKNVPQDSISNISSVYHVLHYVLVPQKKIIVNHASPFNIKIPTILWFLSISQKMIDAYYATLKYQVVSLVIIVPHVINVQLEAF